jgi:hypothetical protein
MPALARMTLQRTSLEACGPVERLRKLLCRLIADHAQVLDFAAALVEEDDSRRAEQAETLQQRLVLGIAKPTGLNIIGNCALFKNPKHEQFENSNSLHTFSPGLI